MTGKDMRDATKKHLALRYLLVDFAITTIALAIIALVGCILCTMGG